MGRKIVVVTDPGIDDAVAISLALLDPQIEMLALAPSAGNVTAEQATKNVQIIVEQIDPPRWPRIGAALPVNYEVNGWRLHGRDGLGGVRFECAMLHHCHPADKLLADEVQRFPGEVTIVALSPLTAVASALERHPGLPRALKEIVIVGGVCQPPGDVGPISEFNFYCDPQAARQVIQCGTPITLVPLEIVRQALFSPTELGELTHGHAPVHQFLRRILPYGLSATSRHYGIEGFRLGDVLGICAVAIPSAFKTRPVTMDIETRGTICRGASVVDLRPERAGPNVYLTTNIDMAAVRHYVRQLLRPG